MTKYCEPAAHILYNNAIVLDESALIEFFYMPNQLPTPSPEQIARSAQLTAHIREQIAQNGGWLPFDAYMNAALYTPKLGYYTNTLSPFSLWAADGDFVTAPLLSPLFGRCLAEQALEVFELTGQNNLLEFGAGTGRLAADILQYLAKQNLAVNYHILELSATLRAAQRAEIESALQGMVHQHRFTWLDALPTDFVGLMLGNEVLDAMPVKLIGMNQGAWFERGVVVKDEQLAWQDRPTSERLPMPREWQDALTQSQSRYLSETHAQQTAFIDSLAQSLKAGVILMIDYGFPAHEFYHPERNTGTLMCHIQHIAHDDALYYAGVQDLTAHVNFSALLPQPDTELKAIGYTNQANFLINNGILEQLAQMDEAQQRIHTNHAHRLISEAEMGELFKVMAWEKGLSFAEDESLQGFCRGDRLGRLD